MSSEQQDKPISRVHVWVSGRVQGVGFRAFVVDSAEYIGVTGWVRNVGWDTVEAVAEGSPQQTEQFVKMMKTGPSVSRVNEHRIEEEMPTGEFAGFEVRYSR
ncbi:MAG: acylphosphatase [Chloroflexi bacterium]|nr:MAG: acylphosphatase [Chloroflexota bacterium]